MSWGLDMVFLKMDNSDLIEIQQNLTFRGSDSKPLISDYLLSNDLQNNECICLKVGSKYPVLTSFV